MKCDEQVKQNQKQNMFFFFCCTQILDYQQNITLARGELRTKCRLEASRQKPKQQLTILESKQTMSLRCLQTLCHTNIRTTH